MEEEFKNIASYYVKKNIFLTGVTGFLGKVILEKLLRSCKDLNCVYVLLREKRDQSAEKRYKTLIASQVFSRLSDKAMRKIKLIVGDITEKYLGICEEDRKVLQKNVHIFIHSAATVRFKESMKSAFEMNVLPLREVISLSREMEKLECLCYVSTAYSQCTMQKWQVIEEKLYKPLVDYKQLIEDIFVHDKQNVYKFARNEVGRYPNSYCLSKAVGEYLLGEEASDLPLVIVRPSIIAPSLLEPMEGWTDTYHGVSGPVAAIGTGMMQTMYAKKCKHDIVPVDMVSNYIIAFIWYAHNYVKTSPIVGNCISTNVNPTSIPDLVKQVSIAFNEHPPDKSFRKAACTTTNRSPVYQSKKFVKHLVPAAFIDGISPLSKKKHHMLKNYKRIHLTTKIIKFITMHEWQWSGQRLQDMLDKMSGEDQEIFFIDMMKINWHDFFIVMANGVNKYLLSDKKNNKQKESADNVHNGNNSDIIHEDDISSSHDHVASDDELATDDELDHDDDSSDSDDDDELKPRCGTTLNVMY